MKTQIKKEKNGTISLVRQGRNLVCPFMAPGVQVNQVTGQTGMVYQACTSNCPHFMYHSLSKEKSVTPLNVVTLSCGGEVREYRSDILLEDSNLSGLHTVKE